MKQPSWAKLFARSSATMTRALKPLREKRRPPAGAGDWLMGVVMAPAGPRRYWLFRPAGVKFGERLPLMVMLHGCHQDAKSFAASTRMNAVAARERFLVLYPEQSRLANAQACWNWFDTSSGRAYGEAAWIMLAVERMCILYAADRERVAVAGLSAGASMAALLATRYPQRFKAVAMHSGIPPGTAHSAVSAVGAMQGRRNTLPQMGAGSAPSAWPPLMIVHGDEDVVVSGSNARAAAQLWSDASGALEGPPRNLHRGRRYPMKMTDFKCASDVVATLVRVEQLGHAWSGGAANTRFSDANGPDASRMVWRFAAKQFTE
jgi:poly(hydroxyalkanoate) depolymerase family esterase